jgi:AhpD family alkylhydroperoxidase
MNRSDPREPFPPSTRAREIAARKQLAPATHAAFDAFSKQVFADGAIDTKTKQLIAVAVAHVTQCPYCIRSHTKAALRAGAHETQLFEAIWVAAEMRAGAAYAHSALALEAAQQFIHRETHPAAPEPPRDTTESA